MAPEGKAAGGRPGADLGGWAEAASDPADFVRRNTAIGRPPLVPEIALHLASEVTPIWLATEESLSRGAVPPPFWAFAWAGGQALARYLLDRPEVVRGREVLDIGSGSGIVAIAAASAGARVVASEIDPFAAAAIGLNAALNGSRSRSRRATCSIVVRPDGASRWPAMSVTRMRCRARILGLLRRIAGRGRRRCSGTPDAPICRAPASRNWRATRCRPAANSKIGRRARVSSGGCCRSNRRAC